MLMRFNKIVPLNIFTVSIVIIIVLVIIVIIIIVPILSSNTIRVWHRPSCQRHWL